MSEVSNSIDRLEAEEVGFLLEGDLVRFAALQVDDGEARPAHLASEQHEASP